MVDSDRSRDRRADILLAAEAEFAAVGWAGGRVERIAAAARVNKQLLFHYFDSKDGLFTAALRAGLARALPPALSTDSPVEEVRQLLGRIQQTVRERPGLLAVLATAATDPSLPADARRSVAEFRAHAVQRLQLSLEDGQRRGHFRDDIDPAEFAVLGVAAALGTGAMDEGRISPIGRLVADACAWR